VAPAPRPVPTTAAPAPSCRNSTDAACGEFRWDPAPAANQPMTVTWQPATEPGSVMVVSLRYNSTPGATQPDLEIACAFEDDGSGTISSTLANGWGAAQPGTQEFAFIRVRERIVEFDDRTRARVRSIFEYPLRPLADAP